MVKLIIFRYTDHEGGNAEMLENLVKKKRVLNGWTLRKILENCETSEKFVYFTVFILLCSSVYCSCDCIKYFYRVEFVKRFAINALVQD